MSSPRRADARAEIARSAAFRLTLRFAAVFVACLLVTDVAVGFGARWVVRQQAMATLEETLAAVASAAEAGGPGGIAEAVSRFASEAEDGEVMLGHQGPA